ncbi:MAG TPA: hypothetical protein VFU15_04635 [Bacteroidia bacterium]|nr:hypothetical protein [Bacteroidia bacterium]
MDCYLVQVGKGAETLHLLTPFSNEELAGNNSRSEFFIGRLVKPEEGVKPENISFNLDFLVAMHQVVREVMAEDPEVTEKAKEQENGFVFIVDRRSPEDSEVEKEDIIGIFLCNERKTDAARYRPNPDYKLISKRGMGMLPMTAEVELKRRILEVPSAGQE